MWIKTQDGELANTSTMTNIDLGGGFDDEEGDTRYWVNSWFADSTDEDGQTNVVLASGTHEECADIMNRIAAAIQNGDRFLDLSQTGKDGK